jgi:hypothetical protein
MPELAVFLIVLGHLLPRSALIGFRGNLRRAVEMVFVARGRCRIRLQIASLALDSLRLGIGGRSPATLEVFATHEVDSCAVDVLRVHARRIPDATSWVSSFR